jgi:hypothetical protein
MQQCQKYNLILGANICSRPLKWQLTAWCFTSSHIPGVNRVEWHGVRERDHCYACHCKLRATCRCVGLDGNADNAVALQGNLQIRKDTITRTKCQQQHRSQSLQCDG